jgi:hypothetical protein
MPSGVQFQSGSGPQTATYYMSGNYPGGDTGVTLRYDGSSWSTGPSLNTGRRQSAAIGGAAAQTAALVAGGYNPPGSPGDATLVEQYDGSSWTAVSVLPLGVHAAGSSGISTNALVFGGSTPSYVKTMAWDGTSWSESANQASNIRRVHNGGGGTDAALGMGGNPGGATTEEFSKSTNVITAAAWASGGAYPQNTYQFSGAGPNTAAIAMAGRVYPGPNGPTTTAAKYDGTSWTAAPSISTGRYQAASAKEGTQTAALITGGYSTTAVNNTEEFNGSSWTGGGVYPASLTS